MAEAEVYDATRLADAAACLRRYFHKHIEGYRLPGDQVDLAFGSLLGEALEIFEKELLAGTSHEDAHEKALAHVLARAVDEDGRNRFGDFHPTWRCLGTAPYKNDKGNAAKCPYSHKGKYFPTPAPDICPCGSEVERVELWVPHKASKDIHTLVELLVGYMDAARERALVPIQIDNQPAVEIYAETTFDAPEIIRPVRLAVNLDAIKAFGAENYIVDYKTTGKSLGASYWATFQPNVQVDFYAMLANILFPNLQIRGVAIEAFSTAGKTSTGFKLIQHTEEQKAETLGNVIYLISQIQKAASAGYWPQNKTACMFCPFQPVCALSPERRQDYLNANYERAKWNPTTRQLEKLPPKHNGIAIPSISPPTTPTLSYATSSSDTKTDISSMMETSGT